VQEQQRLQGLLDAHKHDISTLMSRGPSGEPQNYGQHHHHHHHQRRQQQVEEEDVLQDWDLQLAAGWCSQGPSSSPAAALLLGCCAPLSCRSEERGPFGDHDNEEALLHMIGMDDLVL
jgi:hypothetical protein